MTAHFRKRYDTMMSGKASDFTEHEVFDFLTHMDYFHINTLMIQSCPSKTDEVTQWFTCKVDKPTIKAYLKKSEMRIV